jgi:hypothetical protein
MSTSKKPCVYCGSTNECETFEQDDTIRKYSISCADCYQTKVRDFKIAVIEDEDEV